MMQGVHVKLNPGLPWKKTAFNKEKTIFISKLDLSLRKKVVKCYIWSTAFYGTETWTFQSVDYKYLESFEMWCWRKSQGGEEYPTYNKKKED